MLADKPTSFKPVFRLSVEMNVIKKGVLEVYSLKCLGNNQTDNEKIDSKPERIEPRKRTTRSGSVAVSSFFPANNGSSRVDGGQNRTFSKQQQKYLDEFYKSSGLRVFVTVYRTCTEYFAVIYPLKMILSARLPINCINLRTSKLEKLESNLIKLYFCLRNGEYAYSIVFKILDNEPANHGKQINFQKEKPKKKNESYSASDDDDEQSNDGQSNEDNKEAHHKSYLSSTDDEHESIDEHDNMNITLTFEDHDHSSTEHSAPSDRISFVTWEDALSGKIDIGQDGELINTSSRTEYNKPTLNNLFANNRLPNNGKTTTNSNLLVIRTDDHRRRLSLQTIPETVTE